MRIISKNHDYYDKIMMYGADPSIIFERKLVEYYDLKEFNKDLEEHLSPLFGLFRGSRRVIDPFTVIFCGKIYYGLRTYIENKEAAYWCVNRYVEMYHYNTEEILRVLKEKDIGIKDMLYSKIMIDGKFVKVLPEKRVKMFLENSGSDKFMNLMISKKCPILLVENASDYGAKLKGERNTVLKNVEFFKVFDPYTTYQNLAMFIGGILTKETNPIVEISDKDMVIKKGFNKWSFRKMKED